MCILKKALLQFGIVVCMIHFSSKAGLAQNSDPHPLSSDSTLQRDVTISAAPITLSDLCSKLSSPGCQLQAADGSRSQLLQIKLVNRPMWQIMDAVAHLIPGKWVKNTLHSGFFFEISEATLQHENEWWSLYDRLLSRATGDISNNIVQNLTAPIPNIKPANIYVANYLHFLSIFHQVPQPFIQNMSMSENLDAFLQYPSQSVVARTNSPQILPLSSITGSAKSVLVNKIQNAYQNSTDQPNFPTNPFIEFQLSGQSISIQEILKNGSLLNLTGFTPVVAVNMYMSQYLNPYADDSQLLIQHPKTFPHLMQQLAAYQHSFVWKNTLPNSSPDSGLLTLTPPINRAEKLAWLSHTTGMQYVADYFSEPSAAMTQAEYNKPASGGVDTQLNLMALKNDTSWYKQSDGIVLVRDNRWYRDEPIQVPSAVLDKMWDMVHKAEQQLTPKTSSTDAMQIKENLQLQLEAYAYRKLTPLQLMYGLRFYVQHQSADGFAVRDARYPYRPFAGIVKNTLLNEPILKLYNSLLPQAQDAILSTGISIFALTPVQQQLAIVCAPNLVYHQIRIQRHGDIFINMTAIQPQIFVSSIRNPGANKLWQKGILSDYLFSFHLSGHQQ